MQIMIIIFFNVLVVAILCIDTQLYLWLTNQYKYKFEMLELQKILGIFFFINLKLQKSPSRLDSL